MEIGDFPHQREPQPRTAVLAAAGLIHTEKGLEDALLILLRNATAGIGNANQEFFRFLYDADPHRAAGAVVLDGVIAEIVRTDKENLPSGQYDDQLYSGKRRS